jgi:hypothetical protein
MVNARLWNRHDAHRNAAIVRRVALVSLLLGWSAFWLVTVLQPCCKLAAAQSSTVAASATPHASDAAHHDTGHHPADPVDGCGSLTNVADVSLAAVAAAPSSSSGKAASAVYGYASSQPRAIARADNAFRRDPPLHPPRAVAAFHLRTSRILI